MPNRRRRNFSDPEAHAALALMHLEAGWREHPVSFGTWGVKPERRAIVAEEVDRLVKALRKGSN
jgi:hypothetical protein